MDTTTKTVDQLRDGDVFSIDAGSTWHTCCVPLWGNVAVYVDGRRGDDAQTVRIEIARDALVLVLNLAASTPVEIDTRLADIEIRRANHLWAADQAAAAAERADKRGDTDRYAAEIHKAGELMHAATELNKQAAPLHAEYLRRGGWTRYYLVDNTNGHVHRTRGCSTCYPTTRYLWLTSESGKTPEEVVRLAGERACTVCFPWAPVDVLHQPSHYRTTTEEEREQRAAERERRAANRRAKEITTVDGRELRAVDRCIAGSELCDGDHLCTEVAAWRRAMEDATSLAVYGSSHPMAEAWRQTVTRCVEAIAPRRDTTADALRAEIDKKIAVKARREGWTVQA